jgi:hypothetical protein
MKILICGECPDPLTTVAQNLNRFTSQQIRLQTLPLAGICPPKLDELSVFEKTTVAIPAEHA